MREMQIQYRGYDKLRLKKKGLAYLLDTGRKVNMHKSFQDVFCTSYIYSVYVLCLGGYGID